MYMLDRIFQHNRNHIVDIENCCNRGSRLIRQLTQLRMRSGDRRSSIVYDAKSKLSNEAESNRGLPFEHSRDYQLNSSYTTPS